MSDQSGKGLNLNLKFPVNWRTYAQIIGLIMALTVAAHFGLTINNVSVTSDQILDAANLHVGSSYSLFTRDYSYIIAHPLGDDALYCLQNGTTGVLQSYKTNQTLIESYAIGNLTVGGGSIIIKEIAWNPAQSIPQNVFVYENVAGKINFYTSNFYLNGNNVTDNIANPSSGASNASGILPVTFLIDCNVSSGLYQSWHGANSTLAYSDTNASKVFINTFGNMTLDQSLHIKNGDYNITATITQPTNTSIFGDGHGTRLFLGANVPLLNTSSSQQNFFMRIENVRFDGSGYNQSLVDWVNVKNSWIVQCEFWNSGGNMTRLISTGGYESFYNHIENCYYEIQNGIYQAQDYTVAAIWSQGDNFITNNVFDNWPFQYNMFIAIKTQQGGDQIIGNHITHCWVCVHAGDGGIISSNYFDTFKLNAIALGGKYGTTITSNTFQANPDIPYYPAIDIGGTGEGHSVTGNIFTSMATMDYYISISAGNTNCTVSSNTFQNPEYVTQMIYDSGSSNRIFGNGGFVTENTVLNAANTTATTFVFNHGLASTANSVQVSFNFTGWTSWTWTSTTTQVTVTITGTLPATMEILAADVKYIP